MQLDQHPILTESTHENAVGSARRLSSLRVVLVLTLLVCCVRVSFGAASAEPIRLTLENGLQLALFPDKGENDAVQIWMRINAGSIAESDDQRGGAIVLKRASAFGTATMSEDQIAELFATAGFDSSIGHGAFTHFDQTTIMLASVDDDTTTGILAYYRDLLSGHQISEASFSRARDAIRSIRSEQTKNNQERWIPELLSGTAPGERLPVPEIDVIDQLTLDAVNQFAASNYTPDNATLIVVGNFHPATMIRTIRNELGKLQTPNRDQSPTNTFDPPGVHGRTVVASSTNRDRSEVALVWFQDAPYSELSDTDGIRQLVTEKVASELVRHRINAQLHRQMQGVEETDGSIVSLCSSVRAGQVVAAIKNDQWERAIELLCGQINLLTRGEIGADEFIRARRAILLSWQADQNEWSELSSRERAYSCNWMIGIGVPIDPARWSDHASAVLASVTNQEIHDAIRTIFDPSRSNMLMLAADAGDPSTDEARVVFEDSRAVMPLPLALDWVTTSVPPIISSIPAGGSIDEITQHAESSVWTAKLSNGVIVRQRSMNDPEDITEIRLTLHRAIEDTTLDDAMLTGWRVPSTTTFSPEGIRAILAEYSISIEVVPNDLFVQLRLRAPSVYSEHAIRLASVLLSEPQLDPDAFKEWQRARIDTLQDHTAINEGLVEHAINAYAIANKCAPAPVPCSDPRSVTLQDASAALNHRARTAPLEIAIAGRMDSQSSLELAATFFGALPAREHPGVSLTSASAPSPITTERIMELTTDRHEQIGAVVGFIACPSADLPRVRAMIVAAMLLNKQLNDMADADEIPQGSSVSVYLDNKINGNALLLGAIPGTDPEAGADALAELFDRFAQQPVTREQLAAHIGFVKHTLDLQMPSAMFWADRLGALSARGHRVDDIWNIRHAYLGLTPETLQEAFSQAYSSGRRIHVETRLSPQSHP